MSYVDSFNKLLFKNQINRFVGSGGEILVKAEAASPATTTLELGDCLIGIGVTHLIEGLEQVPGPSAYHGLNTRDASKKAARAFRLVRKEPNAHGYSFEFAALPPDEYSELIRRVSNGAVTLDPKTIPEGTMICSYVSGGDDYTLGDLDGSPGRNWELALSGDAHWFVGQQDPQDFWKAEFPADDLSLLRQIPPYQRIGSIKFGLSLLSGTMGDFSLDKIRHPAADSDHQLCLIGHAAGTAGLRTPFDIGLRTEILFRPLAAS